MVVPVLGEAAALLDPLLISLAGSGGLIGAVVAFTRLGGDKDRAAMSQAQGANEVLQETLAAVERERDYWKQRYDVCLAQHRQLVHELGLHERLDN